MPRKRPTDPLAGWSCQDQMSIDEVLAAEADDAADVADVDDVEEDPMALRDPLWKGEDYEPTPAPAPKARITPTKPRGPYRGGKQPAPPDKAYVIGSGGNSHQTGWEARTRYAEDLWPISTPLARQELLERIAADLTSGVLDRTEAYAERLYFAARCLKEGL